MPQILHGIYTNELSHLSELCPALLCTKSGTLARASVTFADGPLAQGCLEMHAVDVGGVADCRGGLRRRVGLCQLSVCSLSASYPPFFACSGLCKLFCFGARAVRSLVSTEVRRDTGGRVSLAVPVFRPCSAQWPAPPLALLPGFLHWSDLARQVPRAASPVSPGVAW